MNTLEDEEDIKRAAAETVAALIEGDVDERPCTLAAVMLPDGDRVIQVIVPKTGLTHQFDPEFADVLASWLESGEADWKSWTPFAESWARSIRRAIGACAAVGAN